jgi:hypothetical protein
VKTWPFCRWLAIFCTLTEHLGAPTLAVATVGYWMTLILLALFVHFTVKPLIFFQKFKSNNRKDRKELPEKAPRKSN